MSGSSPSPTEVGEDARADSDDVTSVSPITRGCAAVVLLGGVVAILMLQTSVRIGEAGLAATWVRLILRGRVAAAGDGLVIWSTPDGPVQFVITTSCTVVVLVIPMLILAAALLIGRRTRPLRVLSAAVLCAAALVTVSQIRLAVIAAATQMAGLATGFEFAHVFVGSLISLLGFAASAILLIRVGTYRKRRGQRVLHRS